MVSRDRSPQGGRGRTGRGGRGGPGAQGGSDRGGTDSTGGSREAREERRQRRRSRDTSEESGLVERVVQIRRVSKVTSGGRNLTFNAMVVVGDANGSVGASLGKSTAVPDAVRKGTTQARKEMRKMTLNGTTIPHEVVSKFSGSQVLLKPAAPGTGIIAGGGVRAVMEAVGITDVLSKTFGSTNTINIVKATIQGLATLRDPRAVLARRRGVAPAQDAGPVAAASEG